MKGMDKHLKTAWLLACILALSGCAVGNTHAYRDADIKIAAGGDKKVGLATHDERDFVVSGSKSESFVGLTRGGFGNPFDVTTSSGKALADDFTTAISSGLKKRGFTPIPASITSHDSLSAVQKQLVATKADRLLLVRMIEWKSDTWTNTTLGYNLIATVQDSQGKVLAEKQIQGKDNLGGSAINPPGHAKTAVPAAFTQKLETLLNSPEIQNAFN
ncbi:hypothetical protein [Niveibacterium terrae]|uniref:hypothetical protein n=1 Tax=Niveibacterium terrae TaxID=3373598 RepID=UPI003A93932A